MATINLKKKSDDDIKLEPIIFSEATPIKTGEDKDSEWQEGQCLSAQSPEGDPRSFALVEVKWAGAGEENLLGLLNTGIQDIVLYKPAHETWKDNKN